MQKIITVICFLLFGTAVTAQEKVHQWSMLTNYGVKGDNGLIILSLPAPATITFFIAKAGDPKILYTLKSAASKELPVGEYDITFWNIKIPVTIEKQKETRIYAGVLDTKVKKPWEVWTMDSVKVFGAGGPKMIALPAGKYIIKTSGAEIKTTIRDGQVSIFNFTAY